MAILNVKAIGPNKVYPPKREASRVALMNRWDRYYNRRYAGLFGTSEPPFSTILEQEDSTPQRLRPNLFTFVADFWRDAILADKPALEYEGNTRVNDLIDTMRPYLMDAAETVVLDMIKYGVGIFINRVPGRPQAVDPRFWFPVREAFDDNAGNLDIIAYPYSISANAPQQADRLISTVYDSGGGSARTGHYRLEGLTIKEQIGGEELSVAGLPAVIPVTEGQGIYGRSDFVNIEEYVAELHRRESSVSLALDKQANPHLAVPEGVLEVNEDGTVQVSTEGMAIPVPEGAVAPSYIIWDAEFSAQDKAIDRAERRILRFSKIAPILLQVGDNPRSVLSGNALRRLAVPTVNRIRLIRERLTEAIKTTIVGAFYLFGESGGEKINIDSNKITLHWSPELSGGLTDEADALTTLTEAGILDKATAIQLVSKVRREEAEALANDNDREED